MNNRNLSFWVLVIVVIAILDNHHRIVRVNHAMASRLNLSPDECIGKICYTIVHGTNEPPSFCPHVKLMANCREHTAEVYKEQLDGDLLLTASPLHDKEDNLVGYVQVACDITERKREDES